MTLQLRSQGSNWVILKISEVKIPTLWSNGISCPHGLQRHVLFVTVNLYKSYEHNILAQVTELLSITAVCPGHLSLSMPMK